MTHRGGSNTAPELKGGLNDVLCVIMLLNIDTLKRESHTDRSWIAWMTDAVYLEKPQYHGLVIDLTSHAPTERRATACPGLQRGQGAVCAQAEAPLLHSAQHPERHKLIRIPRAQHRSSLDLGKWSELDRIPQFNADPNAACAQIARHPRSRRGRAATAASWWRSTCGAEDKRLVSMFDKIGAKPSSPISRHSPRDPVPRESALNDLQP
ncbi:hypothetical protein EDB89DRAFT_1991309 [Lactarius sanguifluus]|nr:hypothetical protein EDB89DRAFT_1991309 [Lactarius sanguifluus]